MLVLTRKRDESIIIGDNIRVTVVEVRGDQVKLGIEAPRAIPVHREEVYMEIQAENRRAAALGADIDVTRLGGFVRTERAEKTVKGATGEEPTPDVGSKAAESPVADAPAPRSE